MAKAKEVTKMKINYRGYSVRVTDWVGYKEYEVYRTGKRFRNISDMEKYVDELIESAKNAPFGELP